MRSEREFMVKSNQARALWPYLVVLTILFVLSLAAPRSWDRTKPQAEKPTESLPHQHAAAPLPTVLQAQQAHSSNKMLAPLNPPVVEKVTQQYQEPRPALPPLVPVDVSLDPPITTGPSPEFAERLAQVEHQWLAAREQLHLNWEAARAEINNVTVPISRVLRPDVLAKYIATRARAERAHAGALEQQPPQPTNAALAGNIGSPGSAPSAPAPGEVSENWPLASELIARCGELRRDTSTQLWANQTIALLESLATKPLHDPAGRELLQGLRQLANHAASMLARLGNVTDEALPLRRVQFDLLRRLDLWEATARRASEVGPWASCIVPSAERDTRVLKPTQVLLDYLATDPAGVNWKNYLQVDQVHDLSRLTQRPNPPTTKRASYSVPHGDVTEPVAKLINERRQFSERILTRANRAELTKEQQQFLKRPEVQGYLEGLRNWAVQPRLLADMLQTIETYEETRLPSDAAALGQTIADLRRSLDPRDVALGKLLDEHYRNANARLTMTSALLNRIIPKQIPTSELVNEFISGTQARGQRTTTNNVHLRLVPQNAGWNLVYDIAGHVDSHTSSTSGPVTFVNRGASHYTAEKSVLITGAGIRTQPATVFAQNRTRLVGMQTDCDDLPLIGGMVRNVAQKKHEEALPEAEHEISCRVANKAAARIDNEVETRFARLESRFRQNIVSRLEHLGLDPTIVAMQSTEDRATAWFRLAGPEQLASHTARPLALKDSLASVQLHESAFNSFLGSLELSHRTWLLPDLISHVQRKIGRESPIVLPELPENVTLHFADDDPIVMQCVDGQIRILVSLAEIHQAERSWENVEYSVNYRLVADGLQLKLVRDSSVSLRGDHTGRVDVVLRTIGSKVFPRDHEFALLPESVLNDERLRGLVWSQVLVENGWLGLSLGEESTVVARQKASPTTR